MEILDPVIRCAMITIAAALEVPHIYVDIIKGPRALDAVRRHWHSNGDEARTWELALNPRTGPLTHAN